ncbi:transcriptional regulator with XRE-family HTH domain [Pseudomonas sp. BIGb0408]|uniref:Transcriptional regulator with XRE-family HTH domain n=1 Tax=Phytopseudomonas flavescens TaxID=29435 RepID=A0A7Y9XJP8_9GAMM|nr:transcriptional regulator with XRE-family HTH domain [Pseudomonas sp. BIGb0408]NYH72648.1 transcriptional regulator with XRE-family HTH domain [Pseudomonas flavescens]
MLNVGGRLKEERMRLGYNQAKFAALAGVAKTSQFNYEKGERSPDAEYLFAVAERGVDILYVVTGERRPTSAQSISKDEADLLLRYRQLPGDQRSHTYLIVSALAEKVERST